MASSQAHTIIQHLETALVADCVDNKLNEEMAIQAWGDELSAALNSSGQRDRLIVNFQNVQFMSSSALRVLISLNTKCRNKKLTLYLCEINPSIMEVFRITRLESIFKIRKTVQEAIKSK